MTSAKMASIRKIKKPAKNVMLELGDVAGHRDTALYGLLLVLSGVAALIYQVLWARQLTLLVGVEVYSITVAISAFFAGLAAGGAVFGRLADKVNTPLRMYAMLEALVGIFGLGATIALGHAPWTFIHLESIVGKLAWVLPFILVGVPACVMGGTLPVAVRAMRDEGFAPAHAGGLLYAANTAGGILGALLASFVLLGSLGLRGTGLAASLLNFAAVGIALWLERRTSGKSHGMAARVKAVVASRMAVALYAIAGGIALGYEVVWTQAIGQFVSTRAFAFSIVLAVYLTGLALGSWLSTRAALRVRDGWSIFAALITGAALVAVLEFAVMGPWLVKLQASVGDAVQSATGSQALRMYASFLLAGIGMVFVPTTLLGAAFPLALRLAVGAEHVGRDVGAVLAANMAGGIVGTLVTGFVLVPYLGLVRTLGVLAAGAIAVGLISVFANSGVARSSRWLIVACGIAVVLAAYLTPRDRLANLLLATRGGGALVFYEEGRGATVAVAQQRSKDNVFRRLFVQGVSNSGDAMPSMRYMRLQAMLPVLIHEGDPKSVMVVGFGTGITAGETLRYPGLETRVCAELLPAVVRSGQMFPENYKAWDDPHMQIRIRDGRQELMRNTQQYDVITLEPPPPSAAGVANLYSTDFYELAKSRLRPKGLFAQWLPIATQNEKETRELVRSFLDAFPHATLWTTELHEMLLIGSESPIRPNIQTMATRFASGNVTTSLTAVGVDSPAAVLATWVTGREGLERFAAGAEPVTDDRPRIEYGPWVRPNEIEKVLPDLLALETEVPVEGATRDLRADIDRRRTTLMDFYTAGLAAYGGDRDAWREAISKVLATEPENAYYVWIIGRD